MRITPNITMNNSLYNIQRTRSQMDQLQEKIASGKNYNRPSDDPVAVRLLVGLNDRMSAADQYNSNISKADTWFQITNTALTGATSFLEQAKKTLAPLSGGVTDPNVVNNALLQLRSIKQQVVDMANTQMNGIYIFGGTRNLTKPFETATGDFTSGSNVISNMSSVANYSVGMPISGAGIPSGTTVTAVGANSITLSAASTVTTAGGTVNGYAGDSGTFQVEINQGVSQAINIPGDQLFLGSAGSPYGNTDVLQTLDQLIVDVAAGNQAGILSGKAALYNAGIQFNAAQSDLQARLVRIDAAQQMNTSIMNSLSTVFGKIQTADFAQLGIEMSQQKIALDATLSSTAKISQMSLLDFL